MMMSSSVRSRGGLSAAQHLKRIRASAQHRTDPSGTSGIVRSYQADLKRRWARIESLIWQTLVKNDALNPLPRAAANPARRFPSDPGLQNEAFMAWLNNALDDEVLEVVRGPQGAITRNTRWQDVYVRAGFSRGAQHAEEAMRRAGIPFPEQTAEQLFRIPTNAATLANLYSRQFNELQGITQATSQQIGRVLTEGLATGQGPRQMAREMRRAVQTIGRNRSVTMARTEIINAHAESTLNRYADAGVDGVTAQAEFLTAQDDLVCPECQALETGEALALDEARGIIPVHPNCRCVWLPVVAQSKAEGTVAAFNRDKLYAAARDTSQYGDSAIDFFVTRLAKAQGISDQVAIKRGRLMLPNAAATHHVDMAVGQRKPAHQIMFSDETASGLNRLRQSLSDGKALADMADDEIRSLHALTHELNHARTHNTFFSNATKRGEDWVTAYNGAMKTYTTERWAATIEEGVVEFTTRDTLRRMGEATRGLRAYPSDTNFVRSLSVIDSGLPKKLLDNMEPMTRLRIIGEATESWVEKQMRAFVREQGLDIDIDATVLKWRSLPATDRGLQVLRTWAPKMQNGENRERNRQQGLRGEWAPPPTAGRIVLTGSFWEWLSKNGVKR